MIIIQKYRVNREIRAPRVRVIDEQNRNLGIMDISEALELAEEKGLDLVEVAPNSEPPTCKIVDYGKFKYEMMKKEKEARKNQKRQELKEVKLKNKIDKSGLEIKVQTIKRILDEGDKVKITLQLIGKSRAQPEKYKHVIEEIISQLGNVKIEKEITVDNTNIYTIITKG
ncbi:MAG: translation initiation factor IF-3 [Candidatus Calescibacterium sp.]|nr:translation initiation factor IF-3 [Candidatus Calescibacterium sp.]MCX7972446.1 translation initiation factor IF-3 [bacterium]MDW8195663.1 translation initiation factor IF-3 [Candidatus Calescibacterium sp.]